MNYPTFFDQAPTITLRDPLSEFLGSFEEGIVEYGYLDAVKLAGHSCPNVAGTYLMTVKALAALYGDEIPERGAVTVTFPDGVESGVTGVMASVAALITGAAGLGGFKGIGDRFDRRDLLRFNAELACEVAFERADTGARAEASFAAFVVPMSDETRLLLGRLIAHQADDGEARRFQWQWQERVRGILIDHVDDPALIQVRLC